MLPAFISRDVLFTVSTAALALLLTIFYYAVKNKGLPPGPIGVPYLGCWPFLKNSSCHLQLEEMKKKYGDIFSFKVAGRLYINIGSFKTLKEAHIKKAEFFGKRVSEFNLLTMTFSDGITYMHGERWNVFRKFYQQKFREFGLAAVRDSLAGPVYDSIKDISEVLRAAEGKPINILAILTDKCTYIARKMLLGDNGLSEEQSTAFLREYSNVLLCLSAPNLLLNGIIPRYFIFPFMPSFHKALKSQKKVQSILYDIVKEHEKTFIEGHIRDFIDSFISERNERRQKGDRTSEYFTDKVLLSALEQFLGDGILAVSSFIGSFLRVSLQHPEEQEKVYDELVEVLGHGRDPNIEDRANLPYTNAFIFEALRTMDFLPFFPSLECTEETTLGGYRIPKESLTLLNIWSTNHDPEAYEEPYTFKPSRFLSINGKRGAEIPISFGVGKRSCMGEAYTMMLSFLFLTTLIKHFRLTLYGGGDDIKNMLNLEEWKICAVPRHET